MQRAAEKATAAAENHHTALEAAAGGWVREQINAAGDPSYATALSYGDRSGLAEVDDPRCEIPTRAKDRLLELMEDNRMPGGAIGLSGSRGAGKSTLIRAICRPAGRRGDRKEVLGVVVDAPVEYEAREFVLYLFAKVCGEVIGPGGVAELRHRSRPLPSFSSYLTSRGIFVAIAGLILFGVVQLYASLFTVSISLTSGIWGFLLVTAGGLLLSLARRLRHHRDATALKGSDGGDIATAADHLQEIWFQQSFSTGWSGSFTLPAGLGGGITNTAELSRRQLSFPEVVDLFRGFLEQISSNRQVRIGIDELDKMDDAVARRFLNEIKVVFRVPGCFFLISISEDAMSSFERRGLPFRDVFDSSFDDVVPVPHLRLRDSKALLDRRIVGLPLPFVCLIHCTSGGLPRDLIRAARELVELKAGTEMNEAAARLVGEAVRSKAEAMRITARGFRSERHVTKFVDWLGKLLEADADADALLRLCRNFKSDLLTPLAALPDDEDLKSEHRNVQALSMQLAAFAYLASTVLELFSLFTDDSFIDDASGFNRDEKSEEEENEAAAEPVPVDRLASVSQAFSADVNTAWEMLSELRSELDLKTIEFPSAPSGRLVAAPNGGLPGQAARLLRSMSASLVRLG
jgi:hypothetical protein